MQQCHDVCYLSGGMEYASNEGRDWRQPIHHWLTENLKCEVFNPNVESDMFFPHEYPDTDIRALKETDIVRYASIVSRLVEIDCREIAEHSDLVICYWDDSAMQGAGTQGRTDDRKAFRQAGLYGDFDGLQANPRLGAWLHDTHVLIV